MKTTKSYTAKDYIFTKSAAAYILGTESKFIDYIEEDSSGEYYQVTWYNENKTPALIPAFEFKKYFAESRKARSPEIEIKTLNEKAYAARSARDPKILYFVTFQGNLKEKIECSCKDFEIQKDLGIGQPCCKHIYKILEILGYNSLAAYMQMIDKLEIQLSREAYYSTEM